jgi:tetratricopeptide (TPR) repeat protein
MATIRELLEQGAKFIQTRDWLRAEQVCRTIVDVDPSVVAAWYLLGVANQLQGKLEGAVANYEHALRLEPGHVHALNNLAVAFQAQGKVGEAEACLRRAICFNVDHPEAHSNLGNSLQDQGKLDEAVDCYRRAVRLSPDYLDAHNNLGNALRSQGLLSEAVASYDRALLLQSDHPQVRLSRALCWLQMGDFDRGWAEYEWRLKCDEYSIPSFRQPVWDGAPLDGQTILLYADGGLGDTIQFIRYAPLVRERGGRVILYCQQQLARLAASCPGVEHATFESALVPEFEVYAPLMSLPRIFGTTLDNLPAEIPYLSADRSSIEQWSRELNPSSELKIGIAWQGNPGYRRDRERSFLLAQFEPVATLADVRLFSLQHGPGTEQIGEVTNRFAVTDLGSRLADFTEIAAVMRNLDLVIAPDTSLAHLGGALGVPVWLALSIAPDWRWLGNRLDSPWYPTIRLIRQRTRGAWGDVFERIAGELARLKGVSPLASGRATVAG